MTVAKCRMWTLALAAVVALASGAAMAAEQKFVCSRDVWVSAVPAKVAPEEGQPEPTEADKQQFESDTNMGKTPTLKLKTIQEMAILDFDLSALKGKAVTGGWLHMHVANPEVELKRVALPFERKHLLRKIGLSTVSTDWVEGEQATSYRVDRKGLGATFNQASYSKKPWSFPGSDLTDVTMGNGNTFQCHNELEDLDNLWIRVPVSPQIIQSLISRDGYGICVMEHTGQALVNNWIHSREQKGFEPFMVVEVAGDDKDAPAAPQVNVAAAPAEAHMKSGAFSVEINGPADAFAYRVKCNGQDVPHWMVPHPKAGKAKFVYDEAKSEEPVQLEVVAVNAAGNASAAGKASGKASPSLAAPPALPASWQPKAGDPPVRSGKLRAWAFPEICKVRPTNGAIAETGDKDDDTAYQKANSIWDGASNTIRLIGARGEIVACQVAIERTNPEEPLSGISIEAKDFTGQAGKIAAQQVRLFRVWYVRTAQYAVPLAKDQKLEIPAKDNGLKVQNNQAVYVDIAIPYDAKPGQYEGKLAISADGVAAFELPVKLEVFGFEVPKKTRFNPELNIYGAPGGKVGNDTWFECYRVAHYNRCTLSITQTGHDNGVKTPMKLAGQGTADVRIADWNEFDTAFGPLVDGSAFKDLPRAGEPISALQVPIGYGYPLPIDSFYDYKGDKHGKGIGFIHALTAKPIEQAFSDTYKQGFVNFAKAYAEHAQQKKWTATQFMFYLDGKYWYRENGNGTCWWLLDEPYNFDDWMALKFFGQLFRQGVDPVAKDVKFGVRYDISRPAWTRDWLHGVMTHMYVGGLWGKIKRCQIMAKEGPMVLYSYGHCNKYTDSHWGSAAWCLTTYLAGADGVLPWSSLGDARSVQDGNDKDVNQVGSWQNGLVVPNVLGQKAVASIRIMSLRRGAQDVEYLITLGEKYGLNREQVRALVMAKMLVKGQQIQKDADDAAPVSFDKLDPEQFNELREGVARLIEAKK